MFFFGPDLLLIEDTYGFQRESESLLEGDFAWVF